MIQLRNAAALSSAVTVSANASVPFDTVAANTNGNTAFDKAGNGIQILAAGLYRVHASIVGTAASAGAVTLTAYANGAAIPGAFSTVSFGTTADTISIDVPITVAAAASGTAEITFQLSAQVAASNISADVTRIQ